MITAPAGGGSADTPPDAVAVIVPNYNKQKTLRACLESIRAQSHRPVEVVVVDDASTDDSVGIARRFAAEFAGVTVVCLGENRGPAAARNVGVARSSAPLLFFVDSDTALAPDAIANAVAVLGATPGCGMVQGIYDAHPLFDDGPVEAYRVAFEHFWRRRSTRHRTATLFAASLIPRQVFTQTGGFDERLRKGEDTEFGTRLPARYRLVVTETVRTRHDDVDRLLPFLWDQLGFATFTPLVMRALWARRDHGVGMRLNAMSPASTGLVAAGLLTLALVWLSPWLLLALPPLLVGFVAANHEFLRFAHRFRGAWFAGFAAAMHLLFYAVIVVGTGLGVLRAGWAALRRRPGLDPVPAATGTPAGGSGA